VPALHFGAETHVPPLQCGVAPLQTWPQLPQLASSDEVSMHEAPHAVRPPPHVVPHEPPLHTKPPVQARPHNPQLLPSVLRSLQRPLQFVSPEVQVHTPDAQNCPAAHATPQPPQFAASLMRSVQTPPQSVLVPQSSTHTLAWHAMLFAVSHFVPHAPQLALSEVRSTHAVTPGHATFGAAQVHALETHVLPENVSHTTPQAPQLLLSVVVSVHFGVAGKPPVQVISVPGHLHTPPTHA